MFTSPACAQTIVGPSTLGERRPQGVGPHPPLLVGVDDAELRAADSEEPQRAVDRDVPQSRRRRR